MESVEEEIARKVCEQLGIPYPSQDAVEIRGMVKEVIERRIKNA